MKRMEPMNTVGVGNKGEDDNCGGRLTVDNGRMRNE
jgi:hypothetical protein